MPSSQLATYLHADAKLQQAAALAYSPERVKAKLRARSAPSRSPPAASSGATDFPRIPPIDATATAEQERWAEQRASLPQGALSARGRTSFLWRPLLLPQWEAPARHAARRPSLPGREDGDSHAPPHRSETGVSAAGGRAGRALPWAGRGEGTAGPRKPSEREESGRGLVNPGRWAQLLRARRGVVGRVEGRGAPCGTRSVRAGLGLCAGSAAARRFGRVPKLCGTAESRNELALLSVKARSFCAN